MIASLFKLTRSFVIFDLETTSKEPSTARICSLSMKIHKVDGTVNRYRTLVDPGCTIPKEASDINGITDELIRTGCAFCWKKREEHPHDGCAEFLVVPPFSQLAPNLHRGMSNADFGGYNIRYDLQVCVKEFERCELVFSYSGAHILCGLKLWQVIEPRTLTNAYERWCGKTLEGAHDATVDVDASEEVILAQLMFQRGGEKVLPATLQAIHELSFPKDPDWVDSEGKFIFVRGVPCFNFGKHKGRPMQSQKGYLQWMFGSNFSEEVKAIIDRALAGNFPVAQ